MGKPLKNIHINFQQGGKTWHLATVDANSDYAFDVKVRVPVDVKPGRAIVTASSGTGEEKQHFQVLEEDNGSTP